jgi:hypothetical protein
MWKGRCHAYYKELFWNNAGEIQRTNNRHLNLGLPEEEAEMLIT